MRILLTNDDGLNSCTLKALFKRLSREHEIWIVAPDGERSGSSHSVTLKEPIRIEKRAERTFACSGTPVDCVLLASLGLIDGKIDMVISGPNLGHNLGTDIVYSGTAAAARQAVLMGLPALASSLGACDHDFGMDFFTEFLARNLLIFKKLASPDHFLNINFPVQRSNQTKISITFPAVRIYRDTLEIHSNPDGSLCCVIDGPPPESDFKKGSDCEAVASGKISISPILIHPMNHQIEEKYRKAALWTGKGSSG